jgi:dihydrofolate synthase/folylpolyglutamate synthase
MAEESSIAPTRSDLVLKRIATSRVQAIEPGLDRIRAILTALGEPQKRMAPQIHIAGTNGKGSVAAYLRSLLAAAGETAHAFTSPHIMSVHESIVLNGAPIDEARLSEILQRVDKAAAECGATEFEALTAAAFLAFSEAPADYVIVETGLGGAEDATNVLPNKALCIITPIDLDHAEFLGTSPEAIASHKAGVIEAGAPVVFGAQSDAVRSVLETVATELGAPIIAYGSDFTGFEQHGRFVFQDNDGLLDLGLPPLKGRFQIDNCCLAIAAARALSANAFHDPAIVDEGIQNARWPARMQLLSSGPLVEALPAPAEIWLDGGHNAHAARALAQSLADLQESSTRPCHLILAMRRNKDVRAFLEPFAGLVVGVQCAALPDATLGHAPADIAQEAISLGFAAQVAQSVSSAIANVDRTQSPSPRVLICGSFLLAGQVLKDSS